MVKSYAADEKLILSRSETSMETFLSSLPNLLFIASPYMPIKSYIKTVVKIKVLMLEFQ
jgi:hypothetical protein